MCMGEQTTHDGLTVEKIETAYEVLEVVRENHRKESQSNLAEIANEAHYLVQQYEQNADWSQAYDLPEPGNVLVDPEANPRFGDGRVEVSEVTHIPSHRYEIEECHNRSVARLNPTHPGDAPVVKARYVEGSDKVYAFPVTRLSETWP